MNPTQTTVTPMINNQPATGSNKTNNIPNPNPIKHTASVFLNKCIIFLLPPCFCISYENFILFVPFYVEFILFC